MVQVISQDGLCCDIAYGIYFVVGFWYLAISVTTILNVLRKFAVFLSNKIDLAGFVFARLLKTCSLQQGSWVGLTRSERLG